MSRVACHPLTCVVLPRVVLSGLALFYLVKCCDCCFLSCLILFGLGLLWSGYGYVMVMVMAGVKG